jgi:ribosomal protein L40E
MTSDLVQKWFLPVFITFAVVMYTSAFAGYKIQEDAKKRGLSKASVMFWSVGSVFFGLIFVPLYIMFRARAVFAGGKVDERTGQIPTRLCPHCGQDNPSDEKVCRKCKRRVDSDIPLQGTKQCPYCNAENPVAASRCSKCEQVIGTDVED